MSSTVTTHLAPGMGAPGTVREHHEHHELGFLRKYIFSTDHKVIGIQFMFTGLVFFLLGGLLAMAIRWQLGWPWTTMPVLGKLLFPNTGGAITPEYYTMLFTMHGTIMIFFVIIPLLTGAFGNFLIPLMIGAPDMAFPRLNMFGYWAMVPAIACAIMSFLAFGGGPAAGWTAYPPLSTIKSAAPGSVSAQTWWLLALTWVGASSMMGAVNYVTTIVKMRAPGMTLMRMPLTIWALLVAALLQLFALPVLTAASILQLLDRIVHTGFFTPTNLVVNQMNPEMAEAAAGGQPLLWQHLFWFYSHPAVYIMVVPAMGMVSDILVYPRSQAGLRLQADGVLDRRDRGPGIHRVGTPHVRVGHEPGAGPDLHGRHDPDRAAVVDQGVQLARNVVGLAHPPDDRDAASRSPSWRCSSSAASRASGWRRRPIDVYIHDTYIIVAHFHYIVFAGSVFAIFAGITHWFPKMFGRMMNETLGKVHFLGTLRVHQRRLLHDAPARHGRIDAADGRSVRLRDVCAPAAAEPVHLDLRVLSLRVADLLRGELLPQHVLRQARGPEPLEELQRRVGCAVSSGARQLRPRAQGLSRALRVRLARCGRGLLAPDEEDLGGLDPRPMMEKERVAASPWVHRAACALGASAFLLLGLGGLVTTYRVGMAVPDWPTTFGYGMFSYPLDRMLENFGVTIEHGHRLAASAVGLLSIFALIVAATGASKLARASAFVGLLLEAAGLVAVILGGLESAGGGTGVFVLLGAGGLALAASIVLPASSAAFRCAAVAHLAIVAQGLLGGSRVLENEPALAFLHGACAQLVYGAIGAFVVTSSPRWTRTLVRPVSDESGLRGRALLATLTVYAQIVAGAWLRHSGRSDALGLHGILALGVVAVVLGLAQSLRKSASGTASDEVFGRVRKWLLVLLVAQLVLGALSTFAILALSGGFDGGVSVTEAIAATGHVALGALLFATTLAALLWSHRLLGAVARPAQVLRGIHA